MENGEKEAPAHVNHSARQNMNQVFNFDILSNYFYQERFKYIPPHRDNRLSFICSPMYENLHSKEYITDANGYRIPSSDLKEIIKEKKGCVEYNENRKDYATSLAQTSQQEYVRWIIELPWMTKVKA
jgi:hypothetical protein